MVKETLMVSADQEKSNQFTLATLLVDTPYGQNLIIFDSQNR
jgi:hypothetical protein